MFYKYTIKSLMTIHHTNLITPLSNQLPQEMIIQDYPIYHRLVSLFPQVAILSLYLLDRYLQHIFQQPLNVSGEHMMLFQPIWDTSFFLLYCTSPVVIQQIAVHLNFQFFRLFHIVQYRFHYLLNSYSVLLQSTVHMFLFL